MKTIIILLLAASSIFAEKYTKKSCFKGIMVVGNNLVCFVCEPGKTKLTEVECKKEKKSDRTKK